MKQSNIPVLKDIVLVGAGHAHVGVLRNFAMQPLPGVRLTLITREVHTPYSGMLPGMIAGLYSYDDAHIDTGPLCHFAGARLFHSEVTGIDIDNKRITCANRPPVPYDILSLNIGSTPSASVAGAVTHAIPVKPIDGFLARFEMARRRIVASQGPFAIAVVGAGAGGVELILSMQRRLARDVKSAGEDPARLSFTLITSSSEVLPQLPASVRGRFATILRQRGINVIAGSPVERIDAEKAVMVGGRTICADEVFWTTQAAPALWLRQTGLALDADGFIKVRPTLQGTLHDDVFAAGDIASVEGHDLPKSGVYAVREGKPLASNLRRLVMARPLVAYRPQHDALYLISTGERYAVGTRNGLTMEGAWVWRLKDRIDRRFMDKFNTLPAMAQITAPIATPVADQAAIKEISALAMRCGGCGAKVGATVLTRALGAIVPTPRNDVVIGLESPDDAAIVDTGGPRLSVHSVDYFRAIIDDPYLFGKIAANHALGDIYAMGAEPQSALAIATVPYGIEAKVEADLSMMMAGANEVLRDANCALVGGHTSEGAELSLGFSINGLVDRALALRKSGLQPGDALIVTKPIGTGALLAADMRGKAKARWVMAAIEHMMVSNRAAAAVLREHRVRAATDVTGFGLLGHLVEMVRASNVDVMLQLAAIPLLEGLRETLALGIFSSLQSQNVRLRRAIANLEAASTHPLYPALFDPQTAGGLLASLPQEEAGACLKALCTSGYVRAAVIGVVQARSARLEPITIVLGTNAPPGCAAMEGGLERPNGNRLEEPTRAYESIL
jgi:selenide, water dikinase